LTDDKPIPELMQVLLDAWEENELDEADKEEWKP